MIVLCAYLSPVFSANKQPSLLHDQAIEDARNGRHDEALSVLRTLVANYPQNLAYHHDLIVVLSWAGQDKQALASAQSLPIKQLPDYVLENLGQSALHARSFFVMADAFGILLNHHPDNSEFRLNLAWAQIENGRQRKAFATLHKTAKGPDDYIERLKQLAQYTTDHAAYFSALAVYEKLITLTPDADIAKQRIMVMSLLGATHIADQLAAEQAPLFSPHERSTIRGNRIARRIAWGKLPRHADQAAFAETDVAIELLLKQFAGYEQEGTPYSEAALRSRFDLIEALHDRQRMEDIITLHQRLNKQDIEIPNYALMRIADAYHSTHQADIAKNIYQKLLLQEPNNLDIQLALFYVHLDLEDYQAAFNLIDTLATQQTPWRQDSPSARHYANGNKLSIDINAAMARAYAQQPDQAAERLQPLLANAPYNTELRTQLATVSYWRGWPRRGLQQLDRVLAIEAENFPAQESRFNVLLALAEYDQAEQALTHMQQQFPDSARLKNSEKTWQLHNSNELNFDMNRSRSSGSQQGSTDLTAQATLYSRPFAKNWRPYIDSYYSEAEFPEGQFDYQQLAIGLEYRQRDININGAINHDDRNDGLTLNGQWMPDDHWMFGARFDSNDKTVPLRGRLNENIDGRLAGVEFRYQWHESRSLDGSLQQQRFSDDNQRDSLALSLQQRLLASAHYLLTVQLAYFSSQNTRVNAPYFNPDQDKSTELALSNEWIQYRHYSNRLLHRLTLGISQYTQQSYDSADLWNVYYEQQWNLRERFELAYGLGRARHSYDGTDEHSNGFSLRMNWRF